MRSRALRILVLAVALSATLPAFAAYQLDSSFTFGELIAFFNQSQRTACVSGCTWPSNDGRVEYKLEALLLDQTLQPTIFLVIRRPPNASNSFISAAVLARTAGRMVLVREGSELLVREARSVGLEYLRHAGLLVPHPADGGVGMVDATRPRLPAPNSSPSLSERNSVESLQSAMPPLRPNETHKPESLSVWENKEPPPKPSFVVQSNASSFGGITMVVVFKLLTHGVLLLAAFGQLALLITIVFRFAPVTQEIMMRSMATACGFLVYVGARAAGLSVPDLIYKSLSVAMPVTVGLLGVLIPAATGTLLAWYVVTFLNSENALKNRVGMRILAMIMTFVFFLYCDGYVASYGPKEGSDILYFLPNLSFVVAILLYAILKYHPNDVRAVSS